jgi:peptidoglycan/LPS O-acetylase OafA/YrhL
MNAQAEPGRRQWADVVIVFVGLALLAQAIWPPAQPPAAEVRNVVSSWQVYALAGGLSLAALFVGQRWRWRKVARVLLAAAILALMGGIFFVFRFESFGSWLSVIIPIVFLVATVPFVGPMPRATRERVSGPPHGEEHPASR